LHYAVYFLAGVAIGAYGIDRGLLAADGILNRNWPRWSLAAIVSCLAWFGVAALTMENSNPPLVWQFLQALAFVTACGSCCMLALALSFCFADRRLPMLDPLSENAYALYLIHYVFVVWLQYLLLDVSIAAGIKALIVFSGTLLLSWTAIATSRRLETAIRAYVSERRITHDSQRTAAAKPPRPGG
jgi:glucan biosynthesis protein C